MQCSVCSEPTLAHARHDALHRRLPRPRTTVLVSQIHDPACLLRKSWLEQHIAASFRSPKDVSGLSSSHGGTVQSPQWWMLMRGLALCVLPASGAEGAREAISQSPALSPSDFGYRAQDLVLLRCLLRGLWAPHLSSQHLYPLIWHCPLRIS